MLYETSALLPAIERTIQFNDGSVTEYLGDGILALFRVPDGEIESSILNAYRAAKNCLGDTRDIVNDVLKQRYSLPPLDLGIGMAMSKAVVALVGLDGASHPKAIGKCVYYATKLAGGLNQIHVDGVMNSKWPIAQGEGGLKFRQHSLRGIDGYLISN